MMNFKDFLVKNNTDAETYFDKKMNDCINMEDLPDELVECNCCEKHKVNFPTLGCKLPTSVSKIVSLKNLDVCKCDCPCRHIARHLCREWDLVNEVDDIDSDEEISEDSFCDGYNSMDDFIVNDDKKEYRFTKKARKELNKALNLFSSKNIQK
jgi:hypothetical protein